MDVKIRPYNKSTDTGFILVTFSKGLYFESLHFKEPTLKDFIENVSDPYLNRMFENAQIYVASHNDLLLGYCIIDKNCLEWIFIKPDYRNNGLATALIKNKNISTFNAKNLTNVGKKILDAHSNLFKKEELWDGPKVNQDQEKKEEPLL